MTTLHQDKAAATDRLRRALLAFQEAQRLLMVANRNIKGLSAEEAEAFWQAKGARLEQQVQTTAANAVTAFRGFSAAGLVARPEDRHRVTEAQRCLTEGAA